MKFLLLIILGSAHLAHANENFEDFETITAEAITTEDAKTMAKREEYITRAAKSIHERRKLGIDYDEEEGWVDHTLPAASNKEQPAESAFRFSQKKKSTTATLPVVKGVFTDSVKLEYNGITKIYENGDQVGPYFVDKIDLSVVIIRHPEGKRHKLSTDW